jgi:hypothetical protein
MVIKLASEMRNFRAMQSYQDLGPGGAAGDFRHGQLPEYDSGLKRLDTRRRGIGERDLLGARRAQEMVLAVARGTDRRSTSVPGVCWAGGPDIYYHKAHNGGGARRRMRKRRQRSLPDET